MRKLLRFLTVPLLLWGLLANAQTRKVTGKVSSSDNKAVVSATISVKNSKAKTVSNEAGQFTITVPTGAVTIEVSSIGYTSKQVTIGASQTSVDVVLTASQNELSDVVVTALGISKEKKALGYATTTIKSESLVQAASPNFATALYGKAPGVTIGATPGGATSAVNISIRGLSSITGKTQPLIIMNGVPIRDGEASNNNYWADQRIRGNGLLDINPEDIDNISILKGASAAALYGAEAVNGVVLITTKSGAKTGKKGLGVDFSTSASVDQVAYLPQYQNVRGAGAPLNVSNGGQDAAGFVYFTVGGQKMRALPQYSINYGAKFDGQPIMTWDGKVRPYSAQTNNYAGLFQDAHNNNTTIALSNGNENANFRFSLTHSENEGVSVGAKNKKNIANLNTSFKIGKHFSTDIMVNLINQQTHNRPYSVDRLLNNFTGMIGIFDNGQWYKDKVLTSLGYRYRNGSDQSLTPNENIIYSNFRGDIADYMYRVIANTSDENSNRLISSVTNNWQITNHLKFRSRISTDFTNQTTEDKNRSEVPLIFGNSGYFGMSSYQSTINYTDALLTYNNKVGKDLDYNVTGGYTASKETSSSLSRGSDGGLSTENLYDLAASVNTPWSGSNRFSLVKDAFIGTANANYKNYLFAEATVRRDRTSTMNPNNNTFIYPSVNTSFIFTEAMDNIPSWLSYGKLRASWGVVGNYPSPYMANVAYNQSTLGTIYGGQPVLYTQVPTGTFGNDGIRPEQKNEIELGLEARFLNNRFGLEFSYYNAQVKDQILPLTLPSASGAGSILTNIGTLRNQGLELALNGTIIQQNGFKWEATLNLAKNINKVEALAPGLTRLLHADYDGNAAQLVSEVGQPMGDILAHPVLTDANGNMKVGSDGLYLLDADKMVKYGNAMPKLTGGLINGFTYKNFTLDALIDFRYGGSVMPTGINWMTSRGLTKQSLNYMDEAHGGLTYTSGGVTYHDGMLLPGVKADGTKNDIVVSQAYYYWNVYNWGGPQYSSSRYSLYVQENTYIKMREIAIGYNFGTKIASKLGANKLRLSVFGRNLFYLYRTIKDIDSEQTTAGSRWYQNVSNVGTNPSSRTFGVMLRASF
ncbi:MAG: SusC/RagA family TonB-linked outer membrane protein [Chitinophagia bacterium]|jgi:iron complex outermembrane recepter protein